MYCVSGVVFMVQQVLAGLQKEGKAEKLQRRECSAFFKQTGISDLLKTDRNLLNRAEQISWLAEAV